MNFNLVEKKNEQSHMELQLWQILWSIREEVVALHIQKNWYVSFVSHTLVNLLDFEIDVDLFVLLVDFDIEIVLLPLLLILLFWALQIIWYLWNNAGLCDYFVLTHIALIARERLDQTIVARH